MSHSTTIHVLDKSNYSQHRLVSIPNEEPSALAPSSLRFRPRILGLTTNNLTYARVGHLMGWYDIYPIPSNTPAPYNDSSTYGRIAAWGYADIVESTVPEIKAGQAIYGYFPISTGIETIRIAFTEHEGKKINNRIIALDEHRQHLWKIYNRYQVCSALPDLEQNRGLDSLGWDALMQGLFGTAYNLSTYAFAHEDDKRIHPSGTGTWTAADADLSNATVVLLNASGKTGTAFAYALRHNRAPAHQPRTIIGVGSPSSVNVIQKSNLFDKVVLNSDAERTREEIEASGARRVVLFEFGARPGAAASWISVLRASSTPFTLVTIGGEVKVQDPAAAAQMPPVDRSALNIVNASLLREWGIKGAGEKYFEEFEEAWEGFKGRIEGWRLEWGEGMEGWKDGWEAFCRDEVRADRGLVYKL